jgi:hypothetical protein
MQQTELKSVIKLIILNFVLLTVGFILSTSFLNCAQGPLDDSFGGEHTFIDQASVVEPNCFEGVLCVDQNTSNCFDPKIYEVNEQMLVCYKK